MIYSGTFDGRGYTIKNLTVTEKEGANNQDGMGFFGWLSGTVENLNFVNAKVTGSHYVGVVAGYLQGFNGGLGNIKNCTVNGAELNCTAIDSERNGDKCGVLAGYANNLGYVKDCKISKATVKAGRDAGQAVGAVPAGCESNVSNITVDDVTVSANGTSTGANIKNALVGRVG